MHSKPFKDLFIVKNELLVDLRSIIEDKSSVTTVLCCLFLRSSLFLVFVAFVVIFCCRVETAGFCIPVFVVTAGYELFAVFGCWLKSAKVGIRLFS